MSGENIRTAAWGLLLLAAIYALVDAGIALRESSDARARAEQAIAKADAVWSRSRRQP